MDTQNPKINVLQIDQDNFEKVNEIHNNDGFDHSYSLTKERFSKLIQMGECFYMAYYEGKATGIISIDMEIRAKLHFFSVIKDYQGKGIGTALLAKVLEETKKRNYSSIYVYVEMDSPVEKFLINRGFKKVGFYSNRYKKGRHANILEIGL